MASNFQNYIRKETDHDGAVAMSSAYELLGTGFRISVPASTQSRFFPLTSNRVTTNY